MKTVLEILKEIFPPLIILLFMEVVLRVCHR